jgi:hypothetical protein
VESKGLKAGPDKPPRQTTEINTINYCTSDIMFPCIKNNWDKVVEENGLKMNLTIIDTPGFGDQVNNDYWYENCFFKQIHQLNGNLIAGNQLPDTSRINLHCICVENCRRLVRNIFLIAEYIVYCTLSHLLVIRMFALLFDNKYG